MTDNHKLNARDYHPAIRLNRPLARRGLLTLIRKDIPYETIEKKATTWGEFITIKITNQNNQTLHVTNLYIYNDAKNIDLSLLTDIASENHIITGDFNAHNTIWGSSTTDARGRFLEQATDDLALKILNTGQVTHIANNPNHNNSSIDLTLITELNNLGNITWTTDEDTYGSDHIPQMIEIENQYKNPYVPPTTLRFKTEKADWAGYTNGFTTEQWENARTGTGKEIGEKIDQLMIEVGIKYIPNNSKMLNKPNLNKAKREFFRTYPWWTEACSEAKRARIQALRRSKRSIHTEDHEEYKKAKNHANTVIEQAQTQGWVDYCKSLNIESNPKETWDNLKRLEGKNVKSTTIGPLKTTKGIETREKHMANILANHYEFISSDLNLESEFQKIKENRKVHSDELRKKKPNNNKPMNREIQIHEVLNALRSKKKRTAPGPDSITYLMVYHLPKIGQEVVTFYLNKLIQEGPIPKKMKTATVLPILKPTKDKSDPASYRPISLTSNLCKTLETIMNQRLIAYLETEQILTKNQAGFRGRRQCIEQIATLETEIRSANLSLRSNVLAVFLDLEKAFDIMDKDNLLELLNKYKIDGQMYNFILDFLTDRTFKVKIGNTLSDERKLTNGTPQGAVLSSTLFSISVNEVDQQIETKNTTTSQYADDIAIYRRIRSDKRLREIDIKQFGKDTTKVINYLKERGFKINPKKTKAVYFGTNKEANINISNENIQTSPDARYLGVTLDKHLTYKKHMTEKIKQGNKTLGLLYTIRKSKKTRAHKSAAKAVYKNLIEPRIQYGQELYDLGSKTTLKKLDQIHTKSLRVLTGAYRNTETAAIQTLTNEPPPHIKREISQMTLWARTHATKNNPTSEALNSKENTRYTQYFNRRKKLLKTGTTAGNIQKKPRNH